MRVVYFGSGAFGVPTLRHLSERHRLVGVVTQPDRPAGRGGRPTPTPVARWAAEHRPDVPVVRPPKVGEASVVEQVRGWAADAWVVIAFGQKLPARLLEGRFAVNLHASLLPRWRGAAPINAAILGGDTHTGNSVITLADRMDAGMVLARTAPPVEIPPTMTAGELHDLLAAGGPDLIERVLEEHAAGRLRPEAQDESLVTIAGKLGRMDDDLDFGHPADFVRRTVHALTPWPGVTVAIVGPGAAGAGGAAAAGGEGTPSGQATHIKLLRVLAMDRPTIPPTALPTSATAAGAPPGTILDLAGGVVACGAGRDAGPTAVRLLEVQPPGRRAMAWADFVRGGGRLIAPGSRVVSARSLAPERERAGEGRV
jgi:methionyl-tRNA formyltransferase